MPAPRRAPARVLLVEGPDDKHVVRHLCDRTASSLEFEIVTKYGVSNLVPAIYEEVMAPGRKAVGIVVDADDSLQARWNAVSHRLRNEVNVPTPTALSRDGASIEENGFPRIGVWIMPDNESSGEIEEFVRTMIPEGDPVWPLSRQYIEGIPKSVRKFSNGKKTRAEVHAWLATRKTPSLMGAAIGQGELRSDGELCRRFLKWLENLFG